jgi:phosphinothricin acetyltransferase
MVDGFTPDYMDGFGQNPHAAYRWFVETTVYVDAKAHRSGVGRTLYTALLSILRRQGFHSVFAGIALPNAKSVGLHEALGFRPLGVFEEIGFKFGRWHDVGWWRLGLSEGSPGAEPIAFVALATDGQDVV